MDILKYIVKRLLLSVVILLGVSIIIYSLARMMPTDYVDDQYSSAVAQGTMKQEDIDRIKELYGLAMPDAYLTVKMGENSEYNGKNFTKSTKEETRYDLSLTESAITRIRSELASGDLSEEQRQKKQQELASSLATYNEQYSDWYVGSYDGGKNTRLYLKDDGTYQVGTVESRGAKTEENTATDNKDGETAEEDNTIITIDEIFTVKESGTYKIIYDENDVTRIRNIELTKNGQTEETKVEYKVASGWDKFKAILKGYFGWLGKMFKGDLGMSFKYKRPVSEVIVQNMGISFAIAFIATILQFAISIPLGIKAAVNQYGVIDYTVTILAMIGISLPTFFLAALFIRLFSVELGWFEVGGIASASLPMNASWIVKLGDYLWHMVLPMTVLVILSIGSLMRYTRTNTLEALNADYVRTARAKGLSEKTVIYKHAFRNTMIPLVTMMAGVLPSLFGGAMITETVFSIPGIGKLAYDALVAKDVPFIMGYNMFIAILTVIGTLLSDLMYAVVDPRVKVGR